MYIIHPTVFLPTKNIRLYRYYHKITLISPGATLLHSFFDPRKLGPHTFVISLALRQSILCWKVVGDSNWVIG